MSALRADLFDGLVPFIATAEAASFREAARVLGVTASAISKAVARLEASVGVRLLHRTSRRVTLTTDGEEFLGQCRDAVERVRAARDVLTQKERAPRGLLRVSLPDTFGCRVVAALPSLLVAHPTLEVEAILTNRFVQLADENIDVVVRVGAPGDSRCIVRRVRVLRLATVASPAYLARHGAPRLPEEIARHNCLRFVGANGRAQPWAFRGVSPFAVSGNFAADQGDALLAAAVAGVGLLQAPDVMVADQLARGELVEVLRGHAAPGPPLNILFAPGRVASPKVRAFADFVMKVCAEEPAAREAVAAVSSPLRLPAPLPRPARRPSALSRSR